MIIRNKFNHKILLIIIDYNNKQKCKKNKLNNAYNMNKNY